MQIYTLDPPAPSHLPPFRRSPSPTSTSLDLLSTTTRQQRLGCGGRDMQPSQRRSRYLSPKRRSVSSRLRPHRSLLEAVLEGRSGHSCEPNMASFETALKPRTLLWWASGVRPTRRSPSFSPPPFLSSFSLDFRLPSSSFVSPHNDSHERLFTDTPFSRYSSALLDVSSKRLLLSLPPFAPCQHQLSYGSALLARRYDALRLTSGNKASCNGL